MAINIPKRVHKIDDLTLLETLRRLSGLLAENEPAANLQLIPGLQAPLDGIESDEGLAGRFSFQTANFSASVAGAGSFSLSFRRTVKEANTHVPSAQYDEFDLAFAPDQNAWRGNEQTVAEILEIVGGVDLPTTSGGAVLREETGTLREMLVGFGASHRSMLDSLNSAITEVEEKRAALEADFVAKEEARTHAHQEALDDLEEERRKLSLQSHMSERRELLKAMTDETATSVRKSMAPRGAVTARWGVFFAALAIAALAGWLAYTSILQLTVSEASIAALLEGLPENADHDAISKVVGASFGPANWYLIARSILSSLAALGALVYAATWLRGFYNAEVAAAQEIDRFNYDLTRASWIIETVLEVQHEQKGEVPEAWINSVTRGLFDGNSSSNLDDDGTKALRALLGYTAAASFGPEGPKFELGKRQAKRLAKDAEIEG
ncbi:MAG: hypothetical protein ABJF50_10640 [Paracoccaceae bacterium]